MTIKAVYTRVFVSEDRLAETIKFYEGLFDEPVRLRFTHAKAGLELALAGQVLIIAGPAERLAPFRATAATFVVDSVDDYRAVLEKAGADILEPPAATPTGRNMRARHPDGVLIEYVELTPTPS